MAYDKGAVRSTYMAKAKFDAYGAFYREMLTMLSDLYDGSASADASGPYITADSAEAQDFMNAISKIFTDLDALYYPSRP